MKLAKLIVIGFALLAVSACVVEPYGYDGRDHYYRGGERDYGRPVWRE